MSTPPANTDSFRIMSASSLAGTFNKGSAVVPVTLNSGTNNAGTNAAGLFNVSYSGTSATLSNFHQIDVMSVGVNFPDTPKQAGLQGGAAATAVQTAFRNVPGVVTNSALTLNSSNTANVATVTAALAGVQATIHAGDTFIFYVNAHGTFDPASTPPDNQELPIYRQLENASGQMYFSPAATTSQTLLRLSGHGQGNLNSGPSDVISAGNFARLFNTPAWDNVNKIFVIDTCYAMGFWANPGGPGYLSELPRTAIIAASPENLESPYGNFGPGGDLGYAFASTIGGLDGSQVTFNDLFNGTLGSLKNRYKLFAGSTSGVEDYQMERGGVPLSQSLEASATGAATNDFSYGLAGVFVPEPSSAIVVIIGVVFLVAQRRRLAVSEPTI